MKRILWRRFAALATAAGLLCAVLPASALTAGTGLPHGLGLLADDPALRSIYSQAGERPAGRAESLFRLSSGSLPEQVDLSQSSCFPPIQNQGGTGSCAAFVTTAYQFTYEVAKLHGWDAKHDPAYRFSPRWTYTNVNGGEDEGSSFASCYSLLQARGAVRETAFPYTDKDLVSWYQESEGMLDALTNRMLDVQIHTIPVKEGEDTPVRSPEDDSLTEIKTELAVNQKVLAFGCAFISDGSDGDLYIKSTDGRLVRKAFRYEPDRKRGGGHALTIVGYDDALECDIDGDGRIAGWERGAFKVANSWGEGWQTDGGFFWLPYDALNAVSNNKWEPNSHISAFSAVLGGEVYNSYEYYSIDVVSCEPDMVADLRITRGKQGSDVQMALGYSGPDDETCPEENIFCLYNLRLGGGEIEDYRIYLDFTPGMEGDISQLAENRWWFLYSGEDTVSVIYQLKYFADAQAYAQTPPIAAGEFLFEGGRDNGGYLDFSLRYTGDGEDPIDYAHRWIAVSPGTAAEELLDSLLGGTLSLGIGSGQSVPTGARLIQRYRDKIFGSYAALLYGDLDGDGEISRKDLTLLTDYLDGKAGIHSVSLEAAHVSNYLDGGSSGAVTIRDAIALRGYIGTLGGDAGPLGDLDGNEAVEIADVMEACKVLARSAAGEGATAEEAVRGDLDGDGMVTITDVMGICKILARQAA